VPTSVLIVADDPAARESLARLLRPAGHTTAEAPDAHQAAWRLRGASPPRLVLLDLMLPRMAAWEFLRARQGDPALAAAPVLLLADAGQLRPAEATALGADDLLEKPVDVGRLLAAVGRYP
jgi:CheY-like chemotaxis protein